MNRSKPKSTSIPPCEDNVKSPEGNTTSTSMAAVDTGLPPIGRSGKKPDPKKSEAGSSSSMSNNTNTPSSPPLNGGSGEKKKKFSFFNLFKSNKPSSSPTVEGVNGKQGRGDSSPRGGNINNHGEDGEMTSSSSYESVNSVDTTSSFTFVSSKKFRGKGHKGKRIPMDEPSILPSPPNSSGGNNVENDATGGGGGGSRPGSALLVDKEKSSTLNRQPPKKLGTLSRIGVKMGLKKKYNLQSCESLDINLGESLPRQMVAPGAEENKKKKGWKKFSGPVSPRTSVVIEDEHNKSSSILEGSSKNCVQSGNEVNPQENESQEKNKQPKEEKTEKDSSPKSQVLLSPKEDERANKPNSTVNQTQLNQENQTFLTPSPEPVPCSSKSILQQEAERLSPSTGYTSDNANTWSSSTKRKRRAPVPPSGNNNDNNKSLVSSNNVIQIPGRKKQQESDACVNNVELKSVKRLGDDGSVASTSSYPSGALRRRKSKEKSHIRPYSCSCSNSIFAHHSKYQTYHKRCCSDGHHNHGPHPSTSTNASSPNNNNGTLGRSHVKGKKKAPPPPSSSSNPFEDEEEDMEEQSCSNRLKKKDANPENPYGNPFLDEDSGDGNNNEMRKTTTDLAMKEKVSKSSSGTSPAVVVSSSANHVSTSSNKDGPSSSSSAVSSRAIILMQTSIPKTTQLSPSESSTPVTTTTVVSPVSFRINSAAVKSNATPSSNQAVTITTASSSFSRPIPSTSLTSNNGTAVPAPPPLVPSSSPTMENHQEVVSTAEDDDEIAQNLLNDRQEQELLASSVQGSLLSPTQQPTTNSIPSTTTTTTDNAEQSSVKSSSSASSKRIFNFSRNRNSNSHLQPEANQKNDMEALVNSSPTLMAQVKAVDDQVRAQLLQKERDSSNKKQRGGGLFTPKSKKSASSSDSSQVLPLSPENADSLEAAAPRPWYKRSISSSSSPSKSPSATKAKPIPLKLTHLTKFSDLDREAQRIVDENKRKSAELAFNQNARDLINIFNTAFTTASSSSPTTSSITTTAATTVASIERTSTTSSTSSPTNPSPPTSSSSSITSTFLSMANTANASRSTYLGRSSANKIAEPSPTTSTTEQRNVAVVQPQKNSQSATSNTTFSSFTPPLTSSATVAVSTSSTFSVPIVSTNSSTPMSTNVSTTVASTVVPPKPLIGESWSCPRCTLRNPAWRALCEACYYRKFGTNALNSTTSSNGLLASSNASTFSTPISHTTNSTSNLKPNNPGISNNNNPTSSNSFQTPTENGITSINSNHPKSTASSSVQPIKAPPSCENFLSQLPKKEELIKKDEKLAQGMKLNSPTSTNTSTQMSQLDSELDIDKLRQVRVAFFHKEQQQGHGTENQSNDQLNLNIRMNSPDSEDEPVNENNSNQNVLFSKPTVASCSSKSSSSAQKFDDGEDDSIDAMLFRPSSSKNQNTPPPKRPPKNQNQEKLQNLQTTYSSDAGPNFEILLQSNNNAPQSYISPPHSPSGSSATTTNITNNGPIFRFRPMLEAITEADANYYITTNNNIRHNDEEADDDDEEEVDNRPVYQNWQQPTSTPHQHQQQPLFLQTHETGNNAISYPPPFISSSSSPNLQHNTSAVHPHLFMSRQNIIGSQEQDPLASHSSAINTGANFRLFHSNPIPQHYPAAAASAATAQNKYNNDTTNANNTGFDLGSAFASNSHFLVSGFTSDSEPEGADSDIMDRHYNHRRQHQQQRNLSRDRDNRYWNGGSGSGSGAYPGERSHLTYDDYRRLGAIPKGYGGYSGDRGSDSGRRRHNRGGGGACNSQQSSRSQYGDEDDRYFSESSENSMADNPLVASKLLRKLEWAISHGEHRLAASLAHDLALLKVNCVVSKPSADPITIRVYVEDRAMQQGPFLVQVLPTMTLKDLKSKIEGDWGIPSGFQKWILGKTMAEDDFVTLANYDVVSDTMAFLYLVTPQIENLGGIKEKELSPPPPLPKKPLSSPSPTTIPLATTTAAAPKKVASAAQTDDNSLTASAPLKQPVSQIKGTTSNATTSSAMINNKARMPDPVDDVDDHKKVLPLYERPKSPTRGERRPPSVGKIIPLKENESESIQKLSPHQLQTAGDAINSSPKMQKEKNDSILPTSGESQEKFKSSAITARRSQSPGVKPTGSMSTTTTANNNSVPPNIKQLSLHAKLANLRLAAEQAFGKSFPTATQQQSPSVSQGGSSQLVSNAEIPPNNFNQQSQSTSDSSSQPGPSLPPKKQITGQQKLVNTSQVKKTSQMDKRQVSKPTEQSIIPNTSPKTGSNNVNTQQKEDIDIQPGTSKSAAAKIVPTPTSESTAGKSFSAKISITYKKSEPVPKPRTNKKSAQQPDSDSETDKKIINLAQHQQQVTDSKEATAVVSLTPKQEKVESFCQTTLPFPEKKIANVTKSEDKPFSNALTEINRPQSPNLPQEKPLSSASQLSPRPSSSSPQNTGPEFNNQSSNNIIIGNVLVSPIINHTNAHLLGTTSALLRSLSPTSQYHATSPTPNKSQNKDEVSQPFNSQASSSKMSNSGQRSNGKIIAPQPLPLPSNNQKLSQPKPFKLPYFMQQLCAEEIANKKKQESSPPSKVKMIAEKFNSSSSTTGSTQQNNLLHRKYSDVSNISSTTNYYNNNNDSRGGQIIGRRKSEAAAGTILTFSDESKESNIQTYLSMLQMMEKQDIIHNTEDFECPVCLTGVASGDGVTLRDCLHNFCKECLIGAVQYAEDSEVKCPFRDDNYSCESPIQEREIKALVPPEIFEKYLTMSVRLAERKMMNTFHCKTSDCPGWCIFEDDVNIFKCPVCKKKNCITCAAIHEAMDCQQYQRQLAIAAETDEDAKSSRLMLEKMIQNGDALECPACHVVLLKKWGCDWVRCTYCKTEICWITKKLRWGPAGRGDTSGGCKCGVNNIKCHIKCTYCH